ncbi:hypothetical protein K501DRAFT_273283 [Backusella circina FSU 941]|nr:hypothetical protein K501DRAFT_273283 [Backusella circina FSU 941]
MNNSSSLPWTYEKSVTNITFVSHVVKCIGFYEIRSPDGKVGCGTQRMNSRGVLACASDSFHRPAGLTNNKEDGVGLIILGLVQMSAFRIELCYGLSKKKKKIERNSWSVEPETKESVCYADR